MRYTKDKEIYLIQDIRKLFPNMSIPNDADCTSLGYEFLIETEKPFQEGYVAVQDGVGENNELLWKLLKVEVEIPHSITMRQYRLYLLNQNLLDRVEDIVSQNKAWQIEWEYANEVERTNQLITAMQSSLNLTNEEVDNMFIEASKV